MIPNDDRREKCLVSIRRGTSSKFPDFPDDFRICGLHFEDNCFERDFRHELMGQERTFKLKDDSIPIVFSFKKPPAEKRKLSEERAAKRLEREIVSSLTESKGTAALGSSSQFGALLQCQLLRQCGR